MHPDFVKMGAPQRRTTFGAKAGLAAAAALTASVIGWSAATGGAAGTAPSGGPAAEPQVQTVARDPGRAPDSYAGVVERITPAVVTVRSERMVRRVNQQLPDDPLFREFFGDRFRMPRQPQQPRREGGLGSGVIVRADGYILTNNHVVDGAKEVDVELSDGRIFKAKVVGTDAPSDLAVLKIDGSNLATVALGDSDKVRVGDIALAIGNPLGVGQTVTMGIVSAKGRATGLGDGSFEDFIQTDAPINRGNSGGALISTSGELIGINSQILSPSGGNIGIGFAIPANMAKNVMSQLIEHGEVRRGLLGVTVQPVTSDVARSLGLSEVRGALVNGVQAGGPAERAGIKRGDVILSVNGTQVRDGNGLRNEIAQLQPGTKTQIVVQRDGKEQTLSATLSELTAPRGEGEEGGGAAADQTGLGMAVEPLTRELANQLGVNASAGLVVREVQPSGRAADAGLQRGDVIEEVNGKKVGTPDGLRSALSNTDKPSMLLVHRGAQTMFVTL